MHFWHYFKDFKGDRFRRRSMGFETFAFNISLMGVKLDYIANNNFQLIVSLEVFYFQTSFNIVEKFSYIL